MEITTITVQKITLERVKRSCIRSQSYDEFLNMLLDLYEKQPEHPRKEAEERGGVTIGE